MSVGFIAAFVLAGYDAAIMKLSSIQLPRGTYNNDDNDDDNTHIRTSNTSRKNRISPARPLFRSLVHSQFFVNHTRLLAFDVV